MITEDFFIYLMLYIFILVINIMAYTKIPILGIFGIAFTLIIVSPSFTAFAGFEMFALMLAIMNLALPLIAIVRARHGD